MLSGVYQKDEGDIFFEGQPVIINGPLAAQKLGISIIHQEFNLCNDLTVAQNIPVVTFDSSVNSEYPASFVASDAIVNFVQTGVMQGVIVQDAFQIGYQGLTALHEVLEGKDVEKVIDVPAVLVTGDNINDEDIQKIINPLG